MPAARDEAEVGRLDRLGPERARHDVAVQVVDRHERQAPRGGDRLRGREPDEQGADQAGPAGHRHRVDVVEPGPRALQRVGRDRVHKLEVVARGDLRDDPAVAGVQQALRRDRIRADLAAVRHDRGARVVAARLEREDQAVARSGAVRHMIRASSRLSW